MARIFGDPVGGGIRPYGSPSDPPNFRVTRPFADESMPQYGLHDGLDLGNGQTHAPVLAMDDGEVYQAFWDANSGGAGIVRIDHGGGWTTGYAHMDEIYVKVGQRVTRGQKIARMDNTGWSSGAHLHMDTTLNGTRKDPWPMLASAQAEEEEMVITEEEKWIERVTNRTWRAKPNGAKFRAGPGPNQEVVGSVQPGNKFYPTAKVIGGAVDAYGDSSNRWYWGWKQDDGAWKFGAVSVLELEDQAPAEECPDPECPDCPPPVDPCAQVAVESRNIAALAIIGVAIIAVVLIVSMVYVASVLLPVA